MSGILAAFTQSDRKRRTVLAPDRRIFAAGAQAPQRATCIQTLQFCTVLVTERALSSRHERMRFLNRHVLMPLLPGGMIRTYGWPSAGVT
jgi:hypothetical protein